jgi:hypothetical protein
LSNLIDVEAGVRETKEMKITLEKTMSFRFQVHSENPEVVRLAVRGLEDHFEKILNYKVGLVTSDSDGFVEGIQATKRTRVEVKKEEKTGYDTINLVKYDEQQRKEEWNRLLCFAIQPREEEPSREDDQRRKEKLKKRKQKMTEQLEEAKEQLWDIRDEGNFEEKSQWIINRTIKRIEQEVEKDYLKSLYQAQRERGYMDQDTKLQLAKELINTVRLEEFNILLPVDIHVEKLIEDLDDARKDEYLAYRTEMSQERTRKRLYGSFDQEETAMTDTEIDPGTPQRREGQVVYVHPTKMEYHTNLRCEYLTYLDYEEKKPCKVCFEQTEDTLNSTIGSKAIGFVPDKVQ